MGEELLQEAFVQRHPEWVKELQIMLKSGEKAEIQVMTLWAVMSLFHHPDSYPHPNIFSFVLQALSSFGFQFITEQFLPRKLLEGDWI
jgi:meiotic recombination protein SPO11